MSLILLIFLISCAFQAGREYQSKYTLEYNPVVMVALLVLSFMLGVIMIGYLTPQTIWLD
jgi:hypothetical protein